MVAEIIECKWSNGFELNYRMNTSELSNEYCSKLSNEWLNLSNDIGEIVQQQMG